MQDRTIVTNPAPHTHLAVVPHPLRRLPILAGLLLSALLATSTSAHPADPTLRTYLPIVHVSPAQPCACHANLYNCAAVADGADFPSQVQAQACYHHYLSLGRGDIHHLDADHDGTACEESPYPTETNP